MCLAGHKGHYRALNTVTCPVTLRYTVLHGGAGAQRGLSGDNTLHLFLNGRQGGKRDVGLDEQGQPLIQMQMCCRCDTFLVEATIITAVISG